MTLDLKESIGCLDHGPHPIGHRHRELTPYLAHVHTAVILDCDGSRPPHSLSVRRVWIHVEILRPHADARSAEALELGLPDTPQLP